MGILILLLPLSLLLSGAAVAAYFWACRGDQFDDMDGPAYQILFDDDQKNEEDS